jgi:recombination protein RecR
MSAELPRALSELIEALGSLPGVGPRSAERFAYYLFKSDPHISARLADTLQHVHTDVKQCPKTFALINADQDVSPLYSDPDRDKTIVAVVEEPLDIFSLERTGQFKGTYHVLGGAMSPIDNIGPEQLHIPELLERLKTDKVAEVILATNASVEGESTALYIQHQIQGSGLKVDMTRLARGIPVGVDLEYTDQITLSHALEGRRKL